MALRGVSCTTNASGVIGMTRIFGILAVFIFSSGTAHAHSGHVGELAGHAHWVGLAAVLGAAALAALVAKAGRKKQADDEGTDAEEADDQAEGAQA